MYRSGPNFEFVEKHVTKWYVPKWSCTDLALTPQDDLHAREKLRRYGLGLTMDLNNFAAMPLYMLHMDLSYFRMISSINHIGQQMFFSCWISFIIRL